MESSVLTAVALREAERTCGDVASRIARSGPHSIRGQVVYGSLWSLFGYATSQVLRLAANLVLTRLLVPEAFGLMSLVSLFVTGLEMFSDVGIGQCIIQNRRGDEARFLNTAFSVQVVRGTLLWILSCLLAYPFSLLYGEPQLTRVIPVAALSVLINGCASTAVWTLTRHVQLGKVVLLRTLAIVLGAAVTVVWAILSPTVWALVAGTLTTAALQSFGSHLLLRVRNRLQWDSQAAASLSRFGKVIFLSTATWFLAGQAERLILGKFISLADLGVFSMALLLATAVVSALQDVGNRVLFPTVAKTLRTDRSAALRLHGRVRLATLLVVLPMAAALMLGGNQIVSVLLDRRYAGAGWMLQILAVRAALELILIPNTNLLMADARLSYFPIANVGRFLTISVGTVLAFRYWGFHEAVWVLSLAPLIPYMVILCGIRDHFREILLQESVVASAVVATAIAAMMCVC